MPPLIRSDPQGSYPPWCLNNFLKFTMVFHWTAELAHFSLKHAAVLTISDRWSFDNLAGHAQKSPTIRSDKTPANLLDSSHP